MKTIRILNSHLSALCSQLSALYLIIAVLLLASCDSWTGANPFSLPHNKAIRVTSAKFSNKYQTLTVKLDATPSLDSNVRLDDGKTVTCMVSDKYSMLIPIIKPNQPKVERVRYVVPQELSDANFDCLVLLDLCQPASIIEKQYEYIKSLYRMFNHRNLFLSFMLPEGKVTNPIAASDYVVDNYISIKSPLLSTQFAALNLHLTPSEEEADSVSTVLEHAYLFRSVSNVLARVLTHTGTAFDSSDHKMVLIFSDGLVYNENNMPVDPDHFVMQERLINIAKKLKGNVHVYYSSLTQQNDQQQSGNNIMQLLCQSSGGRFFETFNANIFQSNFSDDFNFPLTDYELILSYKEGNILVGNDRYLDISFLNKKDKLLAECTWSYVIGSIRHAIVVGDISPSSFYFNGVIFALSILFTLYIVLQFLVPYIRYCIFQKKYVHKYTGSSMSIRGTLVADTCYYCKAPFLPGDDIVTKCIHTMHLGCWEENGQHCPEHGKHCPQGSHYYNFHNLFDTANSPYFLKWILFASLSTFLSWLYVLGINISFYYDFLQDTAVYVLTTMGRIASDAAAPLTLEGEPVQYASSSLYYMLLITPIKAFILTFVLGFLASYHRIWYKRFLDIFLRAVVASAVTFAAFYLEYCCIFACGLYSNFILIDILTWTTMAYVIMYGSTIHTRVKVDSRRYVIGGAAVGIMGAIFWSFIGMEETVPQAFISIFMGMIFDCSIACVIARPLPVFDHSFLHVTGEIKEMDIALYKWFKQSENAIVTIGKSIGCSLQLSWDTKSNLAPVQAEICQRKGSIQITTVEGDVFVENKLLPEGQWVHLYHGDSFVIGTTKFTYIQS